VELKLNGTHQLLVYAHNINLLGGYPNTRNNDTETLINATKDGGLEVNTKKTTYMLISQHHNAGQDYAIKTTNRSFGNVAQFKYFGRE
jgi:hypothetical protein